MRFNQILESLYGQLDEVAMNPTALQKLAASIDATAGMEFELIVPGIGNFEDGERSPDLAEDRRINSFDDVYDFFHDGEWNLETDVDALLETLQEEFYEWAYEHIDEQFYENKQDIVWVWVRENLSVDDILEDYETDLTSDNIDKFESDVKFEREVWEQVVEQILEDQDANFDNAREEHQETEFIEMDSSEWFSEKYPYALDIWEKHDTEIDWPYWTQSGDEGQLEDLAYEFGRVVGKKTTYSTEYHGGERNPGEYTIEPDSSLEADGEGSGLEFISPPMPISEMFEDIDKIVAWAREKGIATNRSTGLHMNISIPNYSLEKLDFVKLALLMGDEYVLRQFGRLNNTYARSAMSHIKDAIKYNPEDVAKLLAKVKGGFNNFSTKAIHTGETTKFTSINTKNGYIEFRSPGGNWLDDDIDKVKNTMLRFIVALDAATDPKKYAKEYMTKLYKLLTASGADSSTIAIFSKYATGLIDRQELKIMVQRAQADRQEERDKSAGKTKQPTNTWIAKMEGGDVAFRFDMPTNGSTPKDYEAARDEALRINQENYRVKLIGLVQEYK